MSSPKSRRFLDPSSLSCGVGDRILTLESVSPLAMDLRGFLKLNLLLLLCLKSRADSSRSVVFFDAAGQSYIRTSSLRTAGEASSLSMDEVAATASVLLGFAPPASFHADSSSKLNEILFPNPFDRPHAVFVLEVGGVEHSFLPTKYINSKAGSTFSSRVLGSTRACIQLPDDDDVSVVRLDEDLGVNCDAACADKELNDLAHLLGGSYISAVESSNGELKLPLSSGASLNLHIAKKADRHFALSLLSLVRSIRKAVDNHDDFAEGSVGPAEVIICRFTGIEALKEEYGPGDVTHKGEELFQIILAKSVELLQKSYKGKIVGVVLSTNEPNSESMLDVKFSTRVSRWLEEASPRNVTDLEALLVRRTLAWITALILLVSTLIGVYLLLNMPLTRDTLLYSNVKLD